MRLSELKSALDKQLANLTDTFLNTAANEKKNSRVSNSQTYKIDDLAIQIIVNMEHYYNCTVNFFPPSNEVSAEILIEPEESTTYAFVKNCFNQKSSEIDLTGQYYEKYLYDKVNINGKSIR